MPSWDHPVVESQGEYVTEDYWLHVGMYHMYCAIVYVRDH